jgi:hypothetical protein
MNGSIGGFLTLVAAIALGIVIAELLLRLL